MKKEHAVRAGMAPAILAAMTIIGVLFNACGRPESDADAGAKNVVPIAEKPSVEHQNPEQKKQAKECLICDFDSSSYQGQLSKQEIDGLLLALNDEYRAWATYDRVNKDFSDPRPFVNIQKAEGRHIERLQALFASFDLRVPENKWLGNAPTFKSLEEACRAGAAGEIANRELYSRLFGSTKREEIITVYKALQSASEENHLPAFQRCLGSGGSGRGPMNSPGR